MRRAVLTGILGAAGLAGVAVAQAAAPSDRWGFIEQYCMECHNATDWAGGIAFDTLDSAALHADARIWESAIRKLRGRLMPPPGTPQPEAGAVAATVSWLEGRLDEAARSRPDPGYVGLHRLNRKEYANAVRDLLGLEIDATALLPPDDVSDGFDNIANVLQVSPSFIDQFLAAARAVAVQAVGNPSVRPGSQAFFLPGDAEGKQAFHVDGLPLGTRGGMVVDYNFPADGEYAINVQNLVTGIYMLGFEFEHTLVVTVDGQKVYETQVGGEKDLRGIDQNQSPTVDAINSRVRDIRFQAKAGPRKVGVTFVARSFAESDARLFSLAPGGGQERIPRISGFEISGPFRVTGFTQTPSRKRIFTCHPEAEAEQPACAREILGTIARRAFRRPVAAAELDTLMTHYDAGRAQGGFEAGVRAALTKILSSPYFLYRAPATALDPADGEKPLDDLALASRLSFFLWNSLPDDELLELAIQGKLREPDVYRAQVRRLFQSPRAGTLASNFAYQWLGLAKLDEIVPDPAVFPYAANHRDVVGIDGDLRADLRRETVLFVESIVREDRSVLDLLRADYSYLNERVALHYGIRTVKGDRFRRVVLPDSTRHGLLGKGAILMATSYPNRTAPVLRGAWVLENLLGTPASAPPPNVEALPESVAGSKEQPTVRELMARHSTNPSCNACHGVMDPLGFALENFDAVGAWRPIDRFSGAAIDASGVLPDGSVVNGPDDLRRALLARADQFVQTFTEKLLTYALGRTLHAEDMPTVRDIVRRAAAADYRLSTIVALVTESEPFRMQRAPTAAEKPVVAQALPH